MALGNAAEGFVKGAILAYLGRPDYANGAECLPRRYCQHLSARILSSACAPRVFQALILRLGKWITPPYRVENFNPESPFLRRHRKPRAFVPLTGSAVFALLLSKLRNISSSPRNVRGRMRRSASKSHATMMMTSVPGELAPEKAPFGERRQHQ